MWEDHRGKRRVDGDVQSEEVGGKKGDRGKGRVERLMVGESWWTRGLDGIREIEERGGKKRGREEGKGEEKLKMMVGD